MTKEVATLFSTPFFVGAGLAAPTSDDRWLKERVDGAAGMAVGVLACVSVLLEVILYGCVRGGELPSLLCASLLPPVDDCDNALTAANALNGPGPLRALAFGLLSFGIGEDGSPSLSLSVCWFCMLS